MSSPMGLTTNVLPRACILAFAKCYLPVFRLGVQEALDDFSGYMPRFFEDFFLPFFFAGIYSFTQSNSSILLKTPSYRKSQVSIREDLSR